MTGTPRVDVLIVVALQLERAAVRAHLRDLELHDASGLYADVGIFDAGPAPLTVAVIETGAGNVGAAILTARAEDMLRPTLVFMVGVAGGLKDLDIGDVVASSKVYWLEGGKHEQTVRPRPDFAPVSTSLVQLARAVAADGTWSRRAVGQGGGAWKSRAPQALVSPIVCGEKVLADQRAEVVSFARTTYGDAVAVDMEDFGTLRAGAAAERTKVLAVRGISDVIEDKAAADASGSQQLAAANAAAFTFEMLAVAAGVIPGAAATEVDPRAIVAIGAELYPEGPQQNGLWRRAGGDESRLPYGGAGFARWWDAITLLDRGGGGARLSVASLLTTMRADYPNNTELGTIAAVAAPDTKR